MLNVAVEEWGWLEDSPMRKVSSLTEPRGRVRFLGEDTISPDGETIDGERTRLLKACQESSNPYLYPVVVLALSTGMRQGEIMGLSWDDVDLHQGRITLHETKNGERRVVPLVGKALELLKEHAKVRRIGTPLLFPGKVKMHRPGEVATYKPIDLRAPWLAALKAAGIEDFRFHDLRHSTASYLAMNGASLAEIAEVLGHKTLQMVKRYAHLSEAHTASVVARMNERIFGGGLNG
jgi:integrase